LGNSSATAKSDLTVFHFSLQVDNHNPQIYRERLKWLDRWHNTFALFLIISIFEIKDVTGGDLVSLSF
jgi:hypothetical protein